MYPGSTGLTQGTISTQNIGAPNGNAVTANSTVSVDLKGNFDVCGIQVVGTFTGALSVQVTLDGTTWLTVGGTTALVSVGSANTVANIPSATQGVFQMDVSGMQGVRVTALGAVTGAAVISMTAGMGSAVVGIDTPIVLAAGGIVAITPHASITVININSAATTNATASKTSAGSLYEVTVTNQAAAPRFVKFYNKASAPTVGTDVPVLTIPVAAGAMVSLNFGEQGKRFLSGIALAITANMAVTDATAVAVGEVQVHGTMV